MKKTFKLVRAYIESNRYYILKNWEQILTDNNSWDSFDLSTKKWREACKEAGKNIEKDKDCERITPYLAENTDTISKGRFFTYLKVNDKNISDFLNYTQTTNEKKTTYNLFERAKKLWFLLKPEYDDKTFDWQIKIIYQNKEINTIPIVTNTIFNRDRIDKLKTYLLPRIDKISKEQIFIKKLCKNEDIYDTIKNSEINIDVTKIKQLNRITWIRLEETNQTWSKNIKIRIPKYSDNTTTLSIAELAVPSKKLDKIILEIRKTRLLTQTKLNTPELSQFENIISDNISDLLVWETALFMYKLSFQNSPDWDKIDMYRKINWKKILYKTIKKTNFTETILTHIEAANKNFYDIKNKEIKDNWITREQKTNNLKKTIQNSKTSRI